MAVLNWRRWNRWRRRKVVGRPLGCRRRWQRRVLGRAWLMSVILRAGREEWGFLGIDGARGRSDHVHALGAVHGRAGAQDAALAADESLRASEVVVARLAKVRGGARHAVDGRRRLHLRGGAALALGLLELSIGGRVQDGVHANLAWSAAFGARRRGLRGGWVDGWQSGAPTVRRLIPGATRQALHCGGRACWAGVSAGIGRASGDMVEEGGRRT